MRIRTSDDDAGGEVGVGWVGSSWRLLAGPRWGRIQARIVGGMGDVMILSCAVCRGLFVKCKLFRASWVIQAVVSSSWRAKELRTCGSSWVKELELHILSVNQVANEACSSFLSLNEIEQASM